MLKVNSKSSNRLDIELSGKLDAEAMQSALDELIHASESIQNGKMLYVITDLQLPTLGALKIELGRLPALFGLVKKFDRVAVLTDKSWLKTASELEGALIPGLEIKAFNLNERTEAEAWLELGR